MSDIMTQMKGGKSVERNQASVIRDLAARAKRASPMRMPAVDVRQLSDEMLIFWLQKLAPEKYGKAPAFGEDSETGRPGDAERMGESKQTSVISDHFAVAEDRKVRSKTPGSSSELPESRRDFVSQTAGGESVMREDSPELSHRGSAAPSTQPACGGKKEAPAIKIMSMIKIKTERDFANEVGVQELSEEEAPAFGEDSGTGRPGDLESKQSSGISDQLAVAADCRVRSGTPGSSELPESRRDFELQGAGGELVMRKDCPEIERGKAESGKLKIEMGAPQAEMSETPESRCGFVLQDADGELLMRQRCPEIGRRKAESRKLKIEIDGRRGKTEGRWG